MHEILNKNFNLEKKYRLLFEIGKGGMSKVYLAERISDHKKFAIKIINYNSSEDNTMILERFKDEIRLVQSIFSPYVVKIFDYCIDEENDEYWLVMEYIEGFILKDLIEKNGYLNVDDSVNYAIQIAYGMQQIHNKKVIHRDLKDSNIMINNFNEIKIIDFGIALDEETTRKTTEGKIVASVQYLAPEAATTRFDPEVSLDIYALGILLYQMLVGDHPFVGKDVFTIINKHKKERIPDIKLIRPNIPQSLINIVLKSTAKNPLNRYKTMNEMIRDLKTCLRPERILEEKIILNDKYKKNFFEIMSSRKATIIISVFLSLVVLFIIIVIILISI